MLIKLQMKIRLGPLLGGYVDDFIQSQFVITHKSSVSHRAFRASTYSSSDKSEMDYKTFLKIRTDRMEKTC